MRKFNLRRERFQYPETEPPKPETGAFNFRIEVLDSVDNRINHWFGSTSRRGGLMYECEDHSPESAPEYTGQLDLSLSLEAINKIVSEEGLDPANVFISATVDEDHLRVEALHVHKSSDEEKQQEYQNHYDDWEKTVKAHKKYELERIEREMQYLKQKSEKLKK